MVLDLQCPQFLLFGLVSPFPGAQLLLQNSPAPCLRPPLRLLNQDAAIDILHLPLQLPPSSSSPLSLKSAGVPCPSMLGAPFVSFFLFFCFELVNFVLPRFLLFFTGSLSFPTTVFFDGSFFFAGLVTLTISFLAGSVALTVLFLVSLMCASQCLSLDLISAL